MYGENAKRLGYTVVPPFLSQLNLSLRQKLTLAVNRFYLSEMPLLTDAQKRPRVKRWSRSGLHTAPISPI